MGHNKYAVIILLALFGCGQKTNLTEQEINLCKTLSFDQALAGQMKKATNGEIVLIPEIRTCQ